MAVGHEVGGAWLSARGPDGLGPDSDESYDLVLCRIDVTTGDLVFALVPLFPPELRAGPQRAQVAEVEISCPPECAPLLSLPIVARRRGEPAEHWRTVQVGRFKPPTQSRLTVRIELDEAEGVRFVNPPMESVDSQPWAEIHRAMPARIADLVQLDLIVAIELDGAGDLFQARADFANRLVRHVEADPSLALTTRIGLIGYGDHRVYDSPSEALQALYRRYVPERRRATDEEMPRLLTHPLGAAGDAALSLPTWVPAPKRYADAAPLEEALELLAGFDWHAGARRGLIAIADRPPHPAPRESGRVVPCPRWLSWRHLLRGAREEMQVACVAVIGSTHTRPRFDWQTLGLDDLFDLRGAEMDTVLAAAGLDMAQSPDLKDIFLPFPAAGWAAEYHDLRETADPDAHAHL